MIKKDFHSLNYCSICLIKKRPKTHHLKVANLCIREYHFYINLFDKIIFKDNIKYYIYISILNIILFFIDIIYYIYSM